MIEDVAIPVESLEINTSGWAHPNAAISFRYGGDTGKTLDFIRVAGNDFGFLLDGKPCSDGDALIQYLDSFIENGGRIPCSRSDIGKPLKFQVNDGEVVFFRMYPNGDIRFNDRLIGCRPDLYAKLFMEKP